MTELTRAFVLLVVLLKDSGVLEEEADPGRASILNELGDLVAVLAARTNSPHAFGVIISPGDQVGMDARARENDELMRTLMEGHPAKIKTKKGRH